VSKRAYILQALAFTVMVLLLVPDIRVFF